VGECPLFYFVEKMSSVATRAESLVKKTVEAEGFELVYVDYRPEGGRSVLRVFIDKAGGIDISDCAEISKRLSVLLDVEDPIPEGYVLEVSSPGVERPLFREEDYCRFIGHEVRLATKEKIEARRNFVGRIQDFTDHVLTLECEDRCYSIPFQKIRKANLVYRF
jgi:ribosome maturation factor RimP